MSEDMGTRTLVEFSHTPGRSRNGQTSLEGNLVTDIWQSCNPTAPPPGPSPYDLSGNCFTIVDIFEMLFSLRLAFCEICLVFILHCIPFCGIDFLAETESGDSAFPVSDFFAATASPVYTRTTTTYTGA